MTAKELLAKVKALFDIPAYTAPAVPAAPADTSTAVVFSYPVDGGSTVYVDCSDDGIPDIDAADKVYTDPALTQPYPDGTYKVTGTDFGFSVAGGIVSTVTDADGTGPGVPLEQSGGAGMAKPPVPPVPPVAPAAAAKPPAAPLPAPATAQMAVMTPETVASFFTAFATGTPEDRIANLELVAKALMEYNFGWQIREAQQKATADQAINIYKTDLVNAQAELANAKTVMAKQDEKLKGLFEIVEQIVVIPSADPKTLNPAKQERFDKTQAREQRLIDISEALKKHKNK